MPAARKKAAQASKITVMATLRPAAGGKETKLQFHYGDADRKQERYFNGATILGVGYVFPMVYLAWSWKYGKAAGNNPFNVRGLEWETTSPPPTFNFDRTPVVTESNSSYAPHREVNVG